MGACAGKQKKEEKPASSTAKKETTSSGSNTGGASAKSGGNSKTDKYDIGDVLGSGAFSVVHGATNKSDGKKYAIKTIDKKMVEEEDLEMLQREIDIMKRVSHENVLQLIEVFDTSDEISLVMELVDGGELFYKIVERGNYSEKDAQGIVKQMLDGVKYLHDQGIAHRDLKPENLLCATDNRPEFAPFRVVIADFGLSKVFEGGSKLETSCGTPDYVAPEVITAADAYDNSVDIWSAGVITYVLLCGFSPFNSNTQTGLFEKILKCDYSFPDPEWTNISENAKDFIKHMLVSDPKERFNAQQCLDHPWLTGDLDSSTTPLAGGEIAKKMENYNKIRSEEQKKN